MNTETTARAHDELIAGLRALADFYEANPTMPVDGFAELSISCSTLTSDDAEGAALVRQVADLLGTPVVMNGRHTTTARQFHGLRVKAYAVTRADMAEHNALMSYANLVQPDGAQ